MLEVVLSALLSLPVFKEDRTSEAEKLAQLELVALNVRMTSLDKTGKAFLIAWGWHESNYSLRIHRGECHGRECPNGARGPWQNERNKLPDEDWARLVGIENTGYQVARAAWFVDWALRQCPKDPIRGGFRKLGALACDAPLKGEDDRMRTFEAVRAKL